MKGPQTAGVDMTSTTMANQITNTLSAEEATTRTNGS